MLTMKKAGDRKSWHQGESNKYKNGGQTMKTWGTTQECWIQTGQGRVQGQEQEQEVESNQIKYPTMTDITSSCICFRGK